MLRLVGLTALTMIAFAANSLLNRWALGMGYAGVWSFAGVRLLSGAVMLWALVLAQGRRPALRGSIAGPVTLAVYVFGFSYAYTVLDAGVGALILFSGVQLTMFLALVFARDAIPATKWIGAGISLVGLAWLMLPGGALNLSVLGVGSMIAAAIGWGLYSLTGGKSSDPLGNTARNFLLAAPVGVMIWALIPQSMTWQGYVLAILSGAVTSGLGYALWYAVLPRLSVTTAALSQLTVPVIAAAMGAIVLSEPLSPRFAVSAALVLGGVALGMVRRSD